MAFSQVPDWIFMVRPASFGFNSDTASTNAFQQTATGEDNIHQMALAEFDAAVEIIRKADIEVLVLDDSSFPEKTDAIFPNNWISFHADGKMVLYPMMAPSRRPERRQEFIDLLINRTGHQEIIDLTFYEEQQRFLEGTGSIVFDHPNNIAYACRSPRTDEIVLNDLCARLGYAPFMFDAVDESGKPIYHTNVILSLGEKFAVACLDSIWSEPDQNRLLDRLASTHHRVVAISYQQTRCLAGNIMEVKSRQEKRFILLSWQALESLPDGQKNELTRHAELLPVRIPSIERYGGGGIRCMVAGIHLKA